jgi:sulfur-carrier protein
MALKLVFLGRLEDAAGAPEREVATASSLEAVFGALEPELAEALQGERIRWAVNGALCRRDAVPPLEDGDEIAFLPPVSGG